MELDDWERWGQDLFASQTIACEKCDELFDCPNTAEDMICPKCKRKELLTIDNKQKYNEKGKV